MKFTFIIPAKNEQKRIGVCLKSINDAMHDNYDYEIIVVDNGSIDDTKGVAQKYGAAVYIDKYATISRLRNIGAAKADGDILIFIDADCAVTANYAVNIEKNIGANEVGLITGYIDIPENSTWVQKVWSLHRVTNIKKQYVTWAASMNMIIKKDVFSRCGQFDEQMTTCEDVELCARVRMAGYNILYDDDVSVIHYGEACDLRALFNKERWRGKSLFRFTFCKSHQVKELVILMQYYFFLTSIITLVASIILNNQEILFVSLFTLALVPIGRSILISVRSRSATYSLHLFVVWFTYYLARSVSILDGLKQYITDKNWAWQPN